MVLQMDSTAAATQAAHSAHFNALAEKIRAKTARVGVVGLGYVGLPLAVEYAKVGFPVTGIDRLFRRLHEEVSGHFDVKRRAELGAVVRVHASGVGHELHRLGLTTVAHELVDGRHIEEIPV